MSLKTTNTGHLTRLLRSTNIVTDFSAKKQFSPSTHKKAKRFHVSRLKTETGVSPKSVGEIESLGPYL